MNSGSDEVYKNHVIVLNGCHSLDEEVENSEIVTCNTEREIARMDETYKEDPDIAIGYNIFGLIRFMFIRACQTNCVNRFYNFPEIMTKLWNERKSGEYKYKKVFLYLQVDSII